MAQASPTPGSAASRQAPSNDVYTVLTIVAFIAVVGAIAFAIYRCTEFLGTAFPGFA
jgi:hypothetical protein